MGNFENGSISENYDSSVNSASSIHTKTRGSLFDLDQNLKMDTNLPKIDSKKTNGQVIIDLQDTILLDASKKGKAFFEMVSKEFSQLTPTQKALFIMSITDVTGTVKTLNHLSKSTQPFIEKIQSEFSQLSPEDKKDILQTFITVAVTGTLPPNVVKRRIEKLFS